MTFLTEEPDNINTVNRENLRETLRRIRAKADRGEYPRRYYEPFGAEYVPWPTPNPYSPERPSPWGDDMHPKD